MMKTGRLAIMATGLFIALTLVSKAQNKAEVEYRDTLIFNTQSRLKVLFIGKNLTKMLDYTRFDSIKNWFLDDIETARKQESFPSNSLITHYLVHPGGKRRIKSESEDYQQPGINIAHETIAIDLDLAQYAYHLYDLRNNYEIQIYAESPGQITQLRALNFTEAILQLSNEKKELKKSVRIDVQHSENGQWKKIKTFGKRNDLIELSSMVGLNVIGGQFMPELGFQINLSFANKYSVPKYLVGINWNIGMLSDYKEKTFTNMYEVNSYNLLFMFNQPNQKASRKSGFEVGYVHAPGGSLDKNIKVGFLSDIGAFRFGLHFYNSRVGAVDPNNNLIYGFSVKTIF